MVSAVRWENGWGVLKSAPCSYLRAQTKANSVRKPPLSSGSRASTHEAACLAEGAPTMLRLAMPSGARTEFEASMAEFTDCSIAVRPAEEQQPRAFGLPNATAAPFTAGSFVCSVSAGASVNCPVSPARSCTLVRFPVCIERPLRGLRAELLPAPQPPQVLHTCAHSNGTHTEGAAHVLPGARTLSEAWTPAIAPVTTALLLSVTPRRLGDSSDRYAPGAAGDFAITSEAIGEALTAMRSGDAAAGSAASRWLAEAGERACLGAVCLRTLPNSNAKRTRDWTGSNPAFLTGEAAVLCRQLVAPPSGSDAGSAGHLLVDLPSVDREDDGGALIAHRSFFGVTAAGEASALSSGAVLPPASAASGASAAGADAEAEALSAAASGVDNASGDADSTTAAKTAAAGAAGPAGYMPRRTVTEICFFPDSVSDGLYALNLQCANVELDAAPSRPLLAPLKCVTAAP